MVRDNSYAHGQAFVSNEVVTRSSYSYDDALVLNKIVRDNIKVQGKSAQKLIG